MYEVIVHSLLTGADGTSTILPAAGEFVALQGVLQAHFDSNSPLYSLPAERVLARQERLMEHLRAAFAAESTASAIPSRFALGPWYIRSRARRTGGWDPIHGVSVALLDTQSNESAIEHYVGLGLALPVGQECTWSFENDTGGPVRGVTIFLSHTRSRTLSVEAVGGVTTRFASALGGYGTVFQALFAQPLPKSQSLELRWRFDGDPSHVRAVTWWTDPGRPAQASATAEAPPRSVPLPSVPGLVRFARSAAEGLRLRLLLSVDPKDPLADARNFFRALDAATQPDAGTDNMYGLFAGYLRARYLVRAESAGFGDLPNFDIKETAYWLPTARGVTQLMVKLLHKHLGFGRDPDGLERVDAAFMAFAGGQLTDFDTHGAPNGAQFFAFAELALLNLELDEEVHFWAQLLPIFARAAEVFARCYHEYCGPRTTCAYRVVHNPTGARAMDPAALAALRVEWLGVDPTEGFGSVVHAALYDELLRGTLDPFALRDHGPDARDCPGAGATRPSRGFKRSGDSDHPA